MLSIVKTPPPVRRPNDASYLLGISRSTLYRLVDQGELQLVKLGVRSSAITRDSILKFAESRGIPLPSGF